MSRDVPLPRQIACVEREIGMRERVYAKRVREGNMTPQRMKDELDAMRAVLATLREVAAREDLEAGVKTREHDEHEAYEDDMK